MTILSRHFYIHPYMFTNITVITIYKDYIRKWKNDKEFCFFFPTYSSECLHCTSTYEVYNSNCNLLYKFMNSIFALTCIYLLLLIQYHCLWTVSSRGCHQPSSQYLGHVTISFQCLPQILQSGNII